ncbi:MAG: serine hydrolase, partial [Pseudomonadota bacterium]
LPPTQLDNDMAVRMATGLRRAAGQIESGDQMQIGPFAPAGGIAASAADMGRWMRFHLNGGELDGKRLMSEATHARMLSRQFTDRPGAPDLAHGFQNYSIHGVGLFGHGGSTGNFNSLMLFAPELGFGIFASQNSGSGSYSTVNLLSRLMIEREIESNGGSIEVELNTTEADLIEYAGDYRNNRRSHITLTAAFGIQPTASVQAADDGSLITTINGNTDRHYPVAGMEDTFINALGQTVHFQRDDSGRIIVLNDTSGVHSHERVTARGMPWAILLPALLVVGLTITTLLGFWKRFRRQPETTDAGRRGARRAFVTAVGVSIYGILALVALLAISRISVATLSDFPPTALTMFSYAGWGLLILTALLLSGLMPVWRGSEWTIRRRLHYTAYALALPILCAQLWHWNLFGAALI